MPWISAVWLDVGNDISLASCISQLRMQWEAVDLDQRRQRARLVHVITTAEGDCHCDFAAATSTSTVS